MFTRSFNLWSILVLIPICYADILNLRSLTDLTSKDYDKLFTPKYSDQNKKHASHDIHIVDDNGKFIDLSYTSKHSSNTNILKLNEKAHKNKIISLSCSIDDNNNEIIKLTLKSEAIARHYHNDITSSLSHSQKRHFVSSNHKWNCINSKKRIAPILKEITDIKTNPSNQAELILYTKPAALVDVFEELSISYQTNINSDETNHILGTPTNPIISNTRRRLTGFWGKIWRDVKHGIQSAIEYIEDVVKNIHVTDVAEFVAAAAGFPVLIGPNNVSNTWSWNYNKSSSYALSPIQLSQNLTCNNCYSELDIVWSLSIGIEDRALHYLLVTAEGDIEISSEVILSGKYDNDQEYREQTAKQALPDLSFEVAGVTFDMNIYGEMAIGVQTDLKAFAGGFKVTGMIKKGLEYNQSTIHNHTQYNYINEHGRLNHAISGPRSEFASGDILHYARPTLYMEMTHIGDFYFGLQPTFDLALIRDDYRTKCVVHYAPSTKLNSFIGADLEITNWHKKMDFTAVQSNIENLAGCIDKSQIIENQIDTIDIMKSFGDFDWWMWTHDNDSNWFRFDDIDGLNRRVLMDESKDDTQTYLNYPNIDFHPQFSNDDKWDDRSLQWWGNLSTISDVCDDWNAMCDEFDIKSVKPHIGTLEVSLANDSTLIALYRSVIEIIPSFHWDFTDALMMSNVSCTARHRLDLIENKYSNDGIRRYKVSLLEWYCDADLYNLGINDTHHIDAWQCMIRLPLQMSAISLDASLGSIVLFDSGSDWCHVFTLTTKPKYILNDNDIDWERVHYPSKLWYGIWDCEQLLKQGAMETELHFIDYNHNTSETNVIMHLNGNTTFYLYGSIDLQNMTMKLESNNWNIGDKALQFIGVLDIYYDGTMIYAGSIEYEGCTGFLFQGYLDLSQFDDYTYYANDNHIEDVHSDDDDKLINNVVIITFFIGMLASVILMLIIAAFCYFYSKNKQSAAPNYALMTEHQL